MQTMADTHKVCSYVYILRNIMIKHHVLNSPQSIVVLSYVQYKIKLITKC